MYFRSENSETNYWKLTSSNGYTSAYAGRPIEDVVIEVLMADVGNLLEKVKV